MRKRLIAVIVAITTMVALAFCVPLGALVQRTVRQHALDDAARDAQSIAAVVSLVGSADIANELSLVRAGSDGRASVYLPTGTIVGRQDAADESVELARAQTESFNADVRGGAAALTPVVRVDGKYVVRVFVPTSVLRKGVYKAWLTLAALGLALILIAVFIADRLAVSIVRPVQRLAEATRQLYSGDLNARVDPSGPPEVLEVGLAFNSLADRIGDLLEAERENVADLSHRLRTPLAALRLDADGLAGTEAGDRVIDDIDELHRAIDRLINEARRPLRTGAGSTSDLAAIVTDRVGFWSALADDQGRPWSMGGPTEGLTVGVPGADLQAALDALIGNVFTHTPEGAGFRVAIAGWDGTARVVIDDDGPGLPGEHVLERGVSEAGGTGLGLDIVRRTIEDANGELRLANRVEGGLRVEMLIPLAAPSRR